MTVPKAAMDEDHALAATKHEIRFAGQIRNMEAVSESHAMHQPAHEQFRLCALGANQTHALASFGWRESVGHMEFVSCPVPQRKTRRASAVLLAYEPLGVHEAGKPAFVLGPWSRPSL